MSNTINRSFTISIIKEARVDENRTPFVPNQIQTLISNFPDLKIFLNFIGAKRIL